MRRRAWIHASQPRGRFSRALGIAGICVFGVFLTALTTAGAQEPTPAATPAATPAPPPADEPPEEARPTGLPKKGTWQFNFDAGFGAFGFANSLYQDVRPDPSGDLGDNWFEGFVKPALSATWRLGESELYGKASAVGERTFGGAPDLVGEDASSFKPEDLYIGWRSGTSIGGSENLVDLSVGREQYKIGHGFILWDGGGEGGSRGGFWTNARKAWEFAAVGRLKPGRHTFEVFYLDRDEVPESETGTKLWGGNYDLSLGDATTIGASYLKFEADEEEAPQRDGLNVYDIRAFTAPFGSVPDLSFELEYALEDNGDALDSSAWTAGVAYQFSGMGWKPKLSYRFALFEGDDPDTDANEGFDSLLPGFYDWGTWWQGEIGGEYFLSNSNLLSHQFRVHVTPSDSLGTGLMGYFFQADEPASFGDGVTSEDIAIELDAYADWKLNSNFTVSLLAAWATPQDAAEQAFDRTDDFFYGMVYVAYSY